MSGTELLHFFRAEDEHQGCTRAVSIDNEGILTVTLRRDADWSKDQDSICESHSFRLVEVRQEWVEVDR